MVKDYRELAAVISNNYSCKRLLFFRGDNELQFLKDWLVKSDANINGSFNSTIYIRKLIQNCTICGNATEKKYAFGSGNNNVMIILNAPWLLNKVEKKILKSESIILLKKMIKAIKLEFNDCYITNLIKCEITDSDAQAVQMAGNCEYIIKNEIEYIKPRVIVVMGDILLLQNIVHESSDISWYNLDHPITLINNSDLKRPAWNTLKLVAEKLNELK